MDRLPTEILSKIIDYLDTSKEEDNDLWRMSAQSDIASLALTSKGLNGFFTERLYDTPRLETRKQMRLYLRTFTGGITPFTRAARCKKITSYRPRELIFDFSEGWDACDKLPDLRFFDECQHFSCITTLRFYECYDSTHVLPHLLGPGSSLRTHLLTEVEILHTSRYCTDDVGLSFILEAALYAGPECFVDCPILPTRDIFPNRDRFIDPFERNPHHPFGPVRSRANIPSPPTEIIKRARFDFGTFASTWAWDRISEDRLLIFSCEIKINDYPSFWHSLRTLTLTVTGPHHILFIFGGYSLCHVIEMKLQGHQIRLTEDLVLYMRRSITRVDDSSQRFANRTDPRRSDGRRIAPLNLSIQDMEDWIHEVDWLLYPREHGEWPPLRQEEVDIVDRAYFGPQLELLDLYELDIIV